MELFGLPIEEMDTWQKRARGLMFRRNFNSALIFEMPTEAKFNNAIHSMFVFFPFDVLFLDSKKKVVDKKTVLPWRPFIAPKKPAKYIIELPRGTVKKEKLKIGQKIKL